ncbi:TPA: SppA protein, partial [Escherichia coli]|nr:SppA protein [Escherichia coli]
MNTIENNDVYVYIGDIHRDGYLDLTNKIKKRKSQNELKKNVIF